MHKTFRYTAIALCVVMAAACAKQSQDQQKPSTAANGGLTTDAQKLGYAIGVDLAKSLSPIKGDVDTAALKRGLDETLAGKKPVMNAQQRRAVKMKVAMELRKREEAKKQEEAKKNKAEGDKFLAENAKHKGVVTTKSGLQYQIIKPGKGKSPGPNDKVTVNYKGTTIDGKVFDSSYKRGKPATFPLGHVIPGWTEGLQLMKPGAEYKFYIPPQLAYGERGAGGVIGPNQTLIFDVELLKVQKAEEKKSAAKTKMHKKSTHKK